MRADMAKVLVERPRPGSRDGSRPVKGYRKQLRKAMTGPDGPVAREGMTVRHRGHERFFNENLAPLKRFVESRAGRPWDQVYAEICERIDRGNVVQKHILTHLDDFVLTQVILIDGRACHGDDRYSWGHQYGRPLEEVHFRQSCYVCPKTGLLKRIPARRRRPIPGPIPPPVSVRVGDRLQCRLIEGRWELVTLAPLPPELTRVRSTERDVVLNRPVSGMDVALARRTYGAAVYATARRVLGRQEQKQFPIPIDLVR